MNVLFLAPHPFFQHRGTPIAVKLLLESLAGVGHEIDLLTYHEGEDVRIPNVRVHRIPRLPGIENIRPGPSWEKIPCDLLMLLECFKLIRKSRFDVIHAVEEAAFIALVLKAVFGIPFIYDMDSSLAQQLADKYKILRPMKCLLDLFEKGAVRSSIGVIAVCELLEKMARNYEPRKPVLRLEDISLLGLEPHGAKFSCNPLGIEGPVVMYVGNLERYQGIDLLLESFQKAAARRPDAQLVLIGGNEKDIKKYKNRTEELGIKERAHFIGPKPISQLAFYLGQANVLVSPRLQGQNTPMKIYSYLDSGTPVLATRLLTHTQVLDDQIALLVAPEPQAMADGLVALLGDGRFSVSLAQRARARVEEEYSYPAFQRKLLGFYRALEKSVSARARTSRNR